MADNKLYRLKEDLKLLFTRYREDTGKRISSVSFSTYNESFQTGCGVTIKPEEIIVRVNVEEI